MNNQTLKLTHTNYWKKIQEQECGELTKNLLTCMVSAHLTNTIPPTLNDSGKKSLLQDGVGLIELETEDGIREMLEVTEYQPADPKTGRRFVFLRKVYPGGTCVGLAS